MFSETVFVTNERDTSELKHAQKSSCRYCTIPQSDTFKQYWHGIPHIQQTETTQRKKREQHFAFSISYNPCHLLEVMETSTREVH